MQHSIPYDVIQYVIIEWMFPNSWRKRELFIRQFLANLQVATFSVRLTECLHVHWMYILIDLILWIKICLRLLAYLKTLIFVVINWFVRLVLCTWLESLSKVLTWYYPIISMTPNWLVWHVIFGYELSNVTRASLTLHHTQDKIIEHAKSSCCCRMTTIETELQYLKILWGLSMYWIPPISSTKIYIICEVSFDFGSIQSVTKLSIKIMNAVWLYIYFSFQKGTVKRKV